MEADVWIPLLTFFLGQGSLVVLELMRQRAQDRRERLLREEEAGRQQAANEKQDLVALQEALELLRRIAASHLSLVIDGDVRDSTALMAAYRKAEIIWSRAPSATVRDSAKAAATACVAVGAVSDRAELKALKDDLVDQYENGVTRANEAIGLRLREL